MALGVPPAGVSGQGISFCCVVEAGARAQLSRPFQSRLAAASRLQPVAYTFVEDFVHSASSLKTLIEGKFEDTSGRRRA